MTRSLPLTATAPTSPSNGMVVTRRTFGRGALIPTTADLLLQVEEGVVAQVVIHSDGAEVLLGLHGPGQLLTPHPADRCFLNLQAHTDVRLAIFSWQQALQLPDLPARLRARLWQQEAWAAMQARPYLDERLLGVLTLLAEQFGRPVPHGLLIDVRLTHAQLATAIGATRTTVTRLLGTLRQRGLLTTVGEGQEERFCLQQATLAHHHP
ncbi:MAG: Crp/Fnr family transcriptional regulator [Caldilinea sp. CFX5]|nr:Crp/Fnr family transcriptional regulator [Caldilinea sp. CFX5]